MKHTTATLSCLARLHSSSCVRFLTRTNFHTAAMENASPRKRIKIDHAKEDTESIRVKRAAFLDSLSRPVSPPLGQTNRLRSISTKPTRLEETSQSQPLTSDSKTERGAQRNLINDDADLNNKYVDEKPHVSPTSISQVLPSPIQLTKIRDLSPADNKDTVSLHEILGDPLIKEAWIFNFCFDVDWLMQYFDPDVRDSVDVKIVHGSWRREDMNKTMIDDACSRRPNVKAIQAYLPDAFGTHHSKMFVLFRHDDSAQVVIHTANMLSKDWMNMTQAVWRSPLLPLQNTNLKPEADGTSIGSCFKTDLTRYLQAYGNKLKALTQQLQLYDFTDVKAAIIASVPSKFKISATDSEVWGWEMLRRCLRNVSIASPSSTTQPHFVFQVSSIASLASTWLSETLYSVCNATNQSASIIFPTAADIANSLDGYAAGGSIHTKAQKPVHMKQISALKSQLCRWTAGPIPSTSAGRAEAAPHIKTYVRYASKATKNNPAPAVDWALITSANLSTQAWGSAPKLAKGEKDSGEAVVHIQSYEIGVLVWPDLYRDDKKADTRSEAEKSVVMLPAFRKDEPDARGSKASTIVGLRMPYDLPLTPYGVEELPWSPQSSYDSPDRHGRSWQQF